MAKRKHVPPAKQRYDESHPIVSVRVDLDLKKKLEELKEKSGKSVGDVLRQAVGVQARSVGRAYQSGFADDRKEYQIGYACSVCRGLILLRTEDEKRAAATYMAEHGWHHSTCKP